MPTDSEIHTERLLLRPLVASDLDAYHLVMSQDAVGVQLPRGRGCTLEENDETELLYALGAEYWRRGFATEAARASTAWAFDALAVDELVGFVKTDNTGSLAVMRACGFLQVDRVHQWGLDLIKFRRGPKESS
jgi:RimJ/RimL family protein N-acetyltransferase